MSFEEKDVRADAQARWALIEDLESWMTPTAVIGGKVLVGFDPREYAASIRAVEPNAGSEEEND